MRLIPAIDLKAGRCVRLLYGDFERETRYVDDPQDLAAKYRSLGADWLHVVDLDGAQGGSPGNRAILAQLAAQPAIHMQVGGGLRDAASVAQMFELGVARVVIGSAALTDVETVRGWLDLFGPERGGLQHERRDAQMGRGSCTLEQRLLARAHADLEPLVLHRGHVLTMAVQA